MQDAQEFFSLLLGYLEPKLKLSADVVVTPPPPPSLLKMGLHTSLNVHNLKVSSTPCFRVIDTENGWKWCRECGPLFLDSFEAVAPGRLPARYTLLPGSSLFSQCCWHAWSAAVYLKRVHRLSLSMAPHICRCADSCLTARVA
jgi:hypothetical protein